MHDSFVTRTRRIRPWAWTCFLSVFGSAVGVLAADPAEAQFNTAALWTNPSSSQTVVQPTGTNFTIKNSASPAVTYLQLASDVDGNPNFAWQIPHELQSTLNNNLNLRANGATADLHLIAAGAIALDTPYVFAQVNAASGQNLSFLAKGNVPTITLPNDTSAAWPASGVTITPFLTGNNGGNLLMRHRTTASKWQFYDAGNSAILLEFTNGGNLGLGVQSPTHKIDVQGGAYCNGTSWVNASSKAFKQEIRPLENPLEILERVQVYRYKYRPGHGDVQTDRLGVLAEDLPDEVSSADRKGAPTGELIALSLGANKELSKKYETLKRSNVQQQQRIEALETKLSSLLQKLERQTSRSASKVPNPGR